MNPAPASENTFLNLLFLSDITRIKGGSALPKFVDNDHFRKLLRDYQFRAYDKPFLKRGMTPKCQAQINAHVIARDSLVEEKKIPYEKRLKKGFKDERRTDEMLDSLIASEEKYIEFKKKCLKNHEKCQTVLSHRLKTDKEMAVIERELGAIVNRMVSEAFKKWFGGYTNYYKAELISVGASAFWDKLTNFNVEFKQPFSYYTTLIQKAMVGFISDYHDYKKDTMSLSIYENINQV
jgi:hypothetical protein